jgi:prenyl protein peptidase
MGFPRFWGRLSAGESVNGPDVGEGKRTEDKTSSSSNGQLSIIWTVAYYSLLVFGAVSWWKLVWILTDSESALTKF